MSGTTNALARMGLQVFPDKALQTPSGFVRQRYQLVNQAITLAAAGAGVGFGAIGLGLPEGFLYLDCAGCQFTLSTASTNLTATFGGNWGVGTVTTAAGALTGTEVNLVPSTALSAAVARVSSNNRGATATRPAVAAVQDNHSKTMSVFLNIAANAADITDATSAPCFVNGYIDLILAAITDN